MNVIDFIFIFRLQLANYLKDAGVKKGDAVVIYLPMLMELPIAMLACARIGAVHSVWLTFIISTHPFFLFLLFLFQIPHFFHLFTNKSLRAFVILRLYLLDFLLNLLPKEL